MFELKDRMFGVGFLNTFMQKKEPKIQRKTVIIQTSFIQIQCVSILSCYLS